MSSMNFSQETVQEFQLSEVNFDLATPISAGGAINVVTRSGSNDWHGSGYFFYRDHNMAAYPNLQRIPAVPDPFFVRRNPGASLGGPIMKDKLFFFFNYEFLNQVQALSIQSTDPAFALLQNTYGSPYDSKQISLRLDYHLNCERTTCSCATRTMATRASASRWNSAIHPTGRTTPIGPIKASSASPVR